MKANPFARFLLRRLMNSKTWQRAYQKRQTLQEQENQIMEQAPWFGTTGLDEAWERELPHYLRREYGESLLEDEHALKAADLVYLGRHLAADGGQRHYWRIPGTEPDYAVIALDADGNSYMGCGEDMPSEPLSLPSGATPQP